MLMEEERPVLHIHYSILEKILEIASLIAIIINIVVLIKYLPILPKEIPTHFGTLGKPDSWGSKNSLIGLFIVTIIMYFFLTLFNKFPHKYNYVVEITPQNAEVQYKNARKMMIFLKTVIVYAFTYMQLSIVRVALGKSNGLGAGFMVIFLILTFVPLIYYIRRSIKLK